MKKITIVLLFFCIYLGACKKDKTAPTKELKGINQTSNGKDSPLFEFSSATNPQSIAYYAALPYNTGTIVKKINYQLTYKNQTLSNARIESQGSTPITVDYTSNTKKLITASNFYGNRNNGAYAYDSQDRLISNTIAGSNYEYVYDSQNNVEKITLKNAQGIKTVEITLTADYSINPLMDIPLVYLEEDMPMWTWISLSKHNIISLTYIYFNALGNVTDTSRYMFSYTYDEYNRPLTMKKYTYSEFIKGDKGYYEAFVYKY